MIVTRVRSFALPALAALAAGTLIAPAHAASADKEPVFHTTIHYHRFHPATIKIPAGTRIRLMIQNSDPMPEEFESDDLDIEKVIPGNSIAAVLIGPLQPGSYSFDGEFHESTAQGKIVVKTKGK